VSRLEDQPRKTVKTELPDYGDPELNAIAAVCAVLAPLDPVARNRVLVFATSKLDARAREKDE
jgi:hypothetical protein